MAPHRKKKIRFYFFWHLINGEGKKKSIDMQILSRPQLARCFLMQTIRDALSAALQVANISFAHFISFSCNRNTRLTFAVFKLFPRRNKILFPVSLFRGTIFLCVPAVSEIRDKWLLSSWPLLWSERGKKRVPPYCAPQCACMEWAADISSTECLI